MHPLKTLSLLLLPMLIAGAEASCSGPCNCPESNILLIQFSAELNVQLAATGDACPYTPYCAQHLVDGGGCTEYTVSFTQAGTCNLAATAGDGRVQRASLTVQALGPSGCCGQTLSVPSSTPVSLTFDQDASTAGG